MEQAKRTKSADEKLHDQTGDKPEAKVVYDNQTAQQQQQAEESREQDEGLEETFPASDAPAPSNPTSAPVPETEDE